MAPSLPVIRRHLEALEKRVKYKLVMNKRLLQRLCAAILVLTFVVGLPMQGTAMTSQISLTATSGIPMPGGCDTCGEDLATNNCPLVFCVGLSAVVLEKQGLARLPSDTPSNWVQRSNIGRSLSPDPYPPRTPFQL